MPSFRIRDFLTVFSRSALLVRAMAVPAMPTYFRESVSDIYQVTRTVHQRNNCPCIISRTFRKRNSKYIGIS